MKIGIIGTGAIGGTLAKKLAAAGHQVKVSNTRELQELEKVAKELGVIPAIIHEVVKDVEVIIVSVPTIAIPKLSKDLFKNVPDEVIIVDTGNYYPFRDGEIEELKNGKVESVWVSEQIGRPVIKAFNNLLAHTLEHLGKPEGGEGRIALAVSGDDENAKKMISGLINDTGFDAVDAGSLSESWRQQPGTPAYCTELNIAELRQALNDGIKDNAPQLRDQAITTFMERTAPPSHEEMVALNRSLFPVNPKEI
jgi:8-hydroxy-5-deazaflavin:NADPH oxidoreductase